MKLISSSLIVLLSLFMLTSCELVGDIFKTGFWTGIIVVVGIIILGFVLVNKAKRRGPDA